MRSKLNNLRPVVVLVAIGLAGLLPALTKAEPPPDLVNSILRSQQQAAEVLKGQTVAMVCTKCRTVLLSDANTKKGLLGWFQLQPADKIGRDSAKRESREGSRSRRITG